MGRRVWAAAFASALVIMSGSSDANAQFNGGLEGGIAARTGTPSLQPGLAWGVHASVSPVPVLSVGAYYLGYNMTVDGAPATAHKAAFDSFGGKLRLTLPLPASDFRPYGYLGFGRVNASYPVETVPLVDDTSGIPATLLPRKGHFYELPVGLGLGYKTAKILELSIDFGVRPSFGFGGDAYDGPAAYDKTKLGFTGMLGVALDL